MPLFKLFRFVSFVGFSTIYKIELLKNIMITQFQTCETIDEILRETVKILRKVFGDDLDDLELIRE